MIQSRTDLIDYAMRKLGAPVISIEVDVAQVADRVDDAIQFFQDFHYDATERIFLKHQITGTIINVASSTGFIVGETVVAVNGNKFTVLSVETGKLITNNVYSDKGLPGADLLSGIVITGSTSNTITTIVSKIAGDTELESVPVSDLVTGITRVLPWSNVSITGDSYMFDPRYQITLNSFASLGSSSLIYYDQSMSYMSLIDQVIRPTDSIRFNKKMNRVYIDMDWKIANIGSFLVFDCFRILDPEVFIEIYNDRMLKKLVVGMIKKQWAQNTSKYSNIQLLGGVTINAETLMAEAEAEISSAETEIRDSYEIPPMGFLG